MLSNLFDKVCVLGEYDLNEFTILIINVIGILFNRRQRKKTQYLIDHAE